MGYAEDRPLLTHFLGGKTQRPRSPTATLYKSNDQSLHANLNTHVQCYRQGNKTEVEREREITIFYKEKVPQTTFSVQASILQNINIATSSKGPRAERLETSSRFQQLELISPLRHTRQVPKLTFSLSQSPNWHIKDMRFFASHKTGRQ